MTRHTDTDALWRLGSVPVAASVYTGVVAAYMALVSFGNVTDFGTNQAFVQHVLSMDTTFEDSALMWRAITNEAIQITLYIMLIAWEIVTASLLIWATVTWLRALRTGTFERARQLSTLGFTMMVLLFGGGFIVVGGEWFAMWQSTQWNGLRVASQNLTIAALGLILVNLASTRSGIARSD